MIVLAREALRLSRIDTRQLVGREAELGSLLALLDSLPSVAVVSGDAGIGKTTLWLEAVDEAHTRGLRVLSCRPSEAEARYSFSGLADLLGGTVPEGLPTPQREALETALALSAAERPVEERLVAFAFLNAVRNLAGESPLTIAIDDLQWLDEPSLSLLRYALTRLEDEPVAVLLTVRGEVPPWLARLGGLVALELRPLTVGALHEMLRTRLDAALPRPVLLRIWETSGGNPFFALELARALERHGGRIEPGAELPVPETLEGLVLERLGTLTPEAEEACRIVAAASEPTVGLVEAVAGPPGLEEALQARVLELDGERVRFAHPLLASGVAARTVGERKRALHERLAAHATDTEERARHLALAASGPSADVADILEEAARQARARGAASGAAELVEQALRLTPVTDGEARWRRQLEAADLHFLTGDVSRSLTALEGAADEAPPGNRRAAVLLRLGRVRAETAGADEAVAVWREALAEAKGDDELAARIQYQLGEFLRFTEGAEAALAELRAAVGAAERAGSDELTCRVLGAHALVHLNSGRGIDRGGITRAVALEARLAGEQLPATPFLVHQLVWTGDVEAARDALARWSAWAQRREHPDVGSAAWYRALLEWRHGDWDMAAEEASSAVTHAEQFGRDAATITAWPSAVIAAHRGQHDRARALAETGLDASALPRVAEAGFSWVLGFIALSEDDARGALTQLEHAEEVNSGLGILEPALRWHVPDLLDALLAAGEPERAEEMLRPFEGRARELDRPWAIAIAARTEALLRAGRGDSDTAFAAFDEALAAHERVLDPFQHARTLLALGATQRRAKQRRAARETLDQAVACFDALPAPLWAARARAELARIGGRTASRGELTEAERRIAALVADGLSNREVAATLFLAEHSVETALSRVYRKLGVRSRTELAGRLARESGEPPASNS